MGENSLDNYSAGTSNYDGAALSFNQNTSAESRQAWQQNVDHAGTAASGYLPTIEVTDSRLQRQTSDVPYPIEAQPNSVRFQGTDPQNWTSYTAYDAQGRFWRQVTRDGAAYNIRYDQAGNAHYIPMTNYNPATDDYAPARVQGQQTNQSNGALDGLGELTQGARDVAGAGLRAAADFAAQPDKPGVVQVPLDAAQTVGNVLRAVDPGSIVVRTLAGEEQIAIETLGEYQTLLQAMATHGFDSTQAQQAADEYNRKTEVLREQGVFAAAERNPSLVPAELTVNIAEMILGGAAIGNLTRGGRAAELSTVRGASVTRPIMTQDETARMLTAMGQDLEGTAMHYFGWSNRSQNFREGGQVWRNGAIGASPDHGIGGVFMWPGHSMEIPSRANQVGAFFGPELRPVPLNPDGSMVGTYGAINLLQNEDAAARALRFFVVNAPEVPPSMLENLQEFNRVRQANGLNPVQIVTYSDFESGFNSAASQLPNFGR